MPLAPKSWQFQKHGRIDGLFEPSQTPPLRQVKPPPGFNPFLKQSQNELHLKLQKIKLEYLPGIEEAVIRSRWHKQKAKDMGIVLKFPEEFFRRQARSIEEFKKTGEYSKKNKIIKLN